MDDELKELAALAIRNAFWECFSSLVNEYLDASCGLDLFSQEAQIAELTSVYGRDTEVHDSGLSPNICTRNICGNTNGFSTILEALQYEDSAEVHMNGKKVFERKGGEWVFIS